MKKFLVIIAALMCMDITAQVKNDVKEYKIAVATPAKDTLFLLSGEDICKSIEMLWNTDTTRRFKKPVIIFTAVLPTTYNTTASSKRKSPK